jgi:hypothetical protein
MGLQFQLRLQFCTVRRKAKWIDHILRRHCLRNHVTEGRIKVVGRQWKRRKQLLHDLQERRRCCNSKDGALDRTLWRTRYGRDYGPVSRQWRRNDWIVRCWQVTESRYQDWKWTCVLMNVVTPALKGRGININGAAFCTFLPSFSARTDRLGEGNRRFKQLCERV